MTQRRPKASAKLDQIMIGKRFGRGVVIGSSGYDARRSRIWVLKCECGNEYSSPKAPLDRGKTLSCGCLQREERASRGRHGHARRGARSYESRVYSAMVARCQNPNSTGFRYYGGRGIRVCKEWVASFEAFLRDIGERPSNKHEIDRINNDGDYEPGNVRWATRKQQMRNTRAVRPVRRSDGKEYKTIIEAAEEMGVSQTAIGCVCRGLRKKCKGYGWEYIHDAKRGETEL